MAVQYSDPLAAIMNIRQQPSLEPEHRKRLLEMKRNRELNPQGAGATQADIDDLQNQLDTNPDYGVEATKLANGQREAEAALGINQQKHQQDVETQIADWRNPALKQMGQETEERDLRSKGEAARVQTAGNLEVEKEKYKGELAKQDAADTHQRGLYDLLGIGKGRSNPSQTTTPVGAASGKSASPDDYSDVLDENDWQPSISAAGKISLKKVGLSALEKRAFNQLQNATDRTKEALSEMHRLYPGIEQSSDAVQGSTATVPWLSSLTGVGAPKYGGLTDRVGAGSERLKYTLGLPTPFAKLAQEASFGNIEQMAGQLPGVRGLATIVPLFREHQSRWGNETPVATERRLQDMLQIMNRTLTALKRHDTAVDVDPAALNGNDPTDPNWGR